MNRSVQILPLVRSKNKRQRPDVRLARERAGIARRYQPSAREFFPVLRETLLASRPVIGERKTVVGRDKIGRAKYRREPIYGKPTFRNVAGSGVHA